MKKLVWEKSYEYNWVLASTNNYFHIEKSNVGDSHFLYFDYTQASSTLISCSTSIDALKIDANKKYKLIMQKLIDNEEFHP